MDSNDDRESTNTTSIQLKLSPHTPGNMERANSQVSLDRVTNPNSNLFEQLTSTSVELKLNLHIPESMEQANSQISLGRVTTCDPNSNLFEHLETKNELYNPGSPPSADEGNVYQPLNLQDRSEYATSSEYQSLTHSAKELECATRLPISSKASEYLSIPRSGKQHTLSKQREFCFEDVIIKRRKL